MLISHLIFHMIIKEIIILQILEQMITSIVVFTKNDFQSLANIVEIISGIITICDFVNDRRKRNN